jgi:hypothetical protein
MANTVIQLKYSDITNTPVSLNTAEPAYSNTSNKLFIGLSNGSVVAVGGSYYTGLVDAATSANTVSTIVKRDASGIFSATAVRADLYGNANTAAAWQTARTIGVSGDANGTVSIDGSANANIPLTLGSTGVSAGTYGGATQIPTFVVDAKGRLTSAANVAISTSFNIAGDTGSGTVAGGETLTFVGRDGITTVAVDANNSVLIDVDNTVFRTTGGTISGDLAVTGNLVVSGNTITQDVETIVVQDSLIELAANNAADALDIGLFGQYNDGTTKYTALFRDASDSGKYKLLTAGTTKPSAGNTVDPTTFSTGTLVTNIEATTVTIKGINVLDKANGAYDTANSATTTAQNAYNLANTNSTSVASAYNHANGAFNTANSATTTAQNAYNLANGTAIIANTDFTSISVTAGNYGSESIVPVFNLAANGRIASITNTSIAIAASAITSGTLGVARGGTGSSSFTANGVVISGATTTSALTAIASSTEGHVLQISSSGVPTFAHLNGGSF